MSDFNTYLDKYAELAVKVGVNIQEGQTLVVHAPVDSAEFTRLIAKRHTKRVPAWLRSCGPTKR